MRDYVAVQLRLPGRVTWRLYSVNGAGVRACPLGDYRGIPGKSGLRMIRDSLQHGASSKAGKRTVQVSRQVRGQVNFRVS